MITFVFLAAAGAGMGLSYIKIRDFVRDRLRFVDAAQRKSTPWLVGVAAGFAAAVLVPFLPVLGGGTELFVPLEGVIDLDRERSRLREEIARLQDLSAGTRKKLENENFVSRAPEEVVQKERDKLAQYEEQASKLKEKLTELEGGAS